MDVISCLGTCTLLDYGAALSKAKPSIQRADAGFPVDLAYLLQHAGAVLDEKFRAAVLAEVPGEGVLIESPKAAGRASQHRKTLVLASSEIPCSRLPPRPHDPPPKKKPGTSVAPSAVHVGRWWTASPR